MTNEQFAKAFLKCKLYRLAKAKLIKEGKAEKVSLAQGQIIYYDLKLLDIINTMHLILTTAEKKKKGYLLQG